MGTRLATAAGKFRKKKKPEKSRSGLVPFLAWFGESQAIDRIINLERRGMVEEKIFIELNYIIRKVDAFCCKWSSLRFELNDPSHEPLTALLVYPGVCAADAGSGPAGPRVRVQGGGGPGGDDGESGRHLPGATVGQPVVTCIFSCA